LHPALQVSRDAILKNLSKLQTEKFIEVTAYFDGVAQRKTELSKSNFNKSHNLTFSKFPVIVSVFSVPPVILNGTALLKQSMELPALFSGRCIKSENN